MTLKELEIITGSKLDVTEYSNGRISVSLNDAEIMENYCLTSAYGVVANHSVQL